MGVEDPCAKQRLRRAVVRKDEDSDPRLDAPSELRDAILQNLDKLMEYHPTKERVITMVEGSTRSVSPDMMDVDYLSPNSYDNDGEEELQALGKRGVHCHRCGEQGYIAARCGTPEPPKGKGNTGFKGDGKGKGKGK